MKILTFEINGNLMGFEARNVYQVLEEITVSPVCFTPPEYMGLTYYRGELFDVIDLAGLLEKEKLQAIPRYRFIVVRWSNRKMAVAVQNIVGILWTESDDVQDVCYTEDGRTLHVLSLDQIWEKLQGLPYGPI